MGQLVVRRTGPPAHVIPEQFWVVAIKAGSIGHGEFFYGARLDATGKRGMGYFDLEVQLMDVRSANSSRWLGQPHGKILRGLIKVGRGRQERGTDVSDAANYI